MDDGGISKTGCSRTKLEVKARSEGSRLVVKTHLRGHQKMVGSLCLFTVLHNPGRIDSIQAKIQARLEAVCLVKPSLINNNPWPGPGRCGSQLALPSPYTSEGAYC
jgi:hypothetical protein